MARILIAGIGNIFLGDDAFGCEVARQLYELAWPEGVRIADFGIRGLDLTYALLENYDVVIFIDALRRGNAPGTLYAIEPDLEELDSLDDAAAMVETHDMHPLRVLCVARRMGATFGAIRVIGCEPQTFGPEEGSMGLSAPVSASIAPAAKMVESLVKKFSESAVTHH